MEEERVMMSLIRINVKRSILKAVRSTAYFTIKNASLDSTMSAAASVLLTALRVTLILGSHALSKPTVELQAKFSNVKLDWSKMELSATNPAKKATKVKDLFAGKTAQKASLIAWLSALKTKCSALKIQEKS